ncbi:galactose oxidase [Phlyctema vagabunda]|uniref:Galactose oxidase n=1 Tax=Phlyctema vagabunda TaxID=108571 RepID=A0ABR4P5K4_9HELO
MLKLLAIGLALVPGSISAAKTISSDSFQAGYGAANAIDGNTTSYWHTQYSPTTSQLPHKVVIDLGVATPINGFSYLPRQDSQSNGNIGKYILEVSPDNTTWTQVANATWADDKSKKLTSFKTASVRFIRLTALTEAGNRGQWSSAAEFDVLSPSTDTSLGQWGPIISFPLVTGGAFLQANGKVFTYAAYLPYTFGGKGNTISAVYDPTPNAAVVVSAKNISNTGHDMFCPGMSLDVNGRAVVTGGDDAQKTSIYDPKSDGWITGPLMKIARGYQSSTTLSDGRIFTIGGSWSGNRGGKNGEIYSPTSNAWSLLSGCPVAPMLTNDAGGIFRSDNHAWLFGWKNGYAFQAGPSKAMNWYSTTGSGSQSAAGIRSTDTDAMNGNAIMYDAVNGKILAVGGSPSYQDSQATNNANIITITDPKINATVEAIGAMSYRRAFASGVVLPDGKVFITGGQTYALPFSDDTAIMNPELWDPSTKAFTTLPPHTVPRTYHSIALLLPDGTVFTGGGGLCGNCATNHEDGQVYTPPNHFNADGSLVTRPVITSTSASSLAVGSTLSVVTDSAVARFSLIRFGSVTHTVNTDQRRIALTPSASTSAANTYTLQIPGDSGIALPGYWMLFALNAAGVPSVAKTIQILV